MSPSPDPIQVALCTAPDAEVAERIARALVEERLVACANLLPNMRSIYRWEGRVEESAEVLLVLKTRADRVAALADRIREIHPYDVPELIALPVEAGLEAYLGWVGEEARP
ncbi:MAG: divalent-cation tolerance protein CutA [Myxococcota bacterium]|nr:divalent-cation tolerance protein CutA [Myxococcota bacterium]